MAKIDEGGTAFPAPNGEGGTTEGMSLRDYFAGQVIGAIYLEEDQDADFRPDRWANLAYEIADAMISRSKR